MSIIQAFSCMPSSGNSTPKSLLSIGKESFDPKEAERIAAIARRAEERALKRIKRPTDNETQANARASQANQKSLPRDLTSAKAIDANAHKVRFRSKEERERDALVRLQAQREQVRLSNV